MNEIKFKEPSKILFIKLGVKGFWEKECIEGNLLHFGYSGTNHQDCLNGNYESVEKYFADREIDKGATTRHINQIKDFYDSDENVLWITFYAKKMWWCFSKKEVKSLDDNTKIRPVIGMWSDKDLLGNQLSFDKISGKLLKVQGFQGTICSVNDKEYALNKIKGIEAKEVINVKETLKTLKENIVEMLKLLDPKDFEILIDLIFRQGGWYRLGGIGGTEKDIDLDLLQPITNQKYAVQIKSKSSKKEFDEYCEKFELMTQYDKFLYVIHTTERKLETKNPKISLLYGEEIADLVISAGLIAWLLNKVS